MSRCNLNILGSRSPAVQTHAVIDLSHCLISDGLIHTASFMQWINLYFMSSIIGVNEGC